MAQGAALRPGFRILPLPQEFEWHLALLHPRRRRLIPAVTRCWPG
ncbi:hypothetical protein [Siccirubricoccus phaeus]|nr:hypothetical protein [Siccirubricoccus phaeus]